MTWLRLLSNLSAVVQITGNVIVMFYVFPAYRRTSHRAFLLIWLACLLGVFATICDHTIGLESMEPTQYLAYRTLRRITHFVDVGLDVVGVVWLTQSYLQRVTPLTPATAPGEPTDCEDAPH